MEVVLQSNLILIRTRFDDLKSAWMASFLETHAHDLLFLPKALLIFYNSTLRDDKEAFIEALSTQYSKNHDFSSEFYLRSMMRYVRKPIKIEFISNENTENVHVELFAHDSETVVISMLSPNPWVISYLRSQLDEYIRDASDNSLVLDVSDMRAKSRLERALNKRHVLHYNIQYRYDAKFMQHLYREFAGFEFDETHALPPVNDDPMVHYYTVLECPVGASQDALKQSYKKLVKVYHPDRVYCETPEVVNHYTQKFQLLQEAYTALRIVS